MGLRRQAREAALQLLYEWDLNGAATTKENTPLLFHPLLISENVEETGFPEKNDGEIETDLDVSQFCEMLVEGVTRNVREIDQLIESHSTHWKVSRMALVDRNILRMAVFEILYCEDIPPFVSINEAIEIGKRFGTEESGAFINGVLDHIAKDLKKS